MPLNRGYADESCSVANTLDVVGERWTLLIVRELLMGVHRFDDLQGDLGIARNVLQTRLAALLEQGVVQRRPYQEHPPRYEYRLTDAGLELWPVIASLMQWGDRHRARPQGPSVMLTHRGCGGAVNDHLCCGRCGAAMTARDVWAQPAEHLPEGHPLKRRDRSGDPETAAS